MVPTYSTADVAAKIGCHRNTVMRFCREKLGIPKQGRDYRLTAQQAAALKKSIRTSAGNPNFAKSSVSATSSQSKT
jgi:DNA-binding MurR/RpiR family transcriptional regulator